MRKAEQIVHGLLEDDDPKEFIDRQADMLLLAALLRNKWKVCKAKGTTRAFGKNQGEFNGYEEWITLYLDRQADGSVSVTAGGQVNYAGDAEGIDWRAFEKEIDKEWIFKPGENVDEFVEGLTADLSQYHSTGEPCEPYED